MSDERTPEYLQGVDAANRGIHFHECPYAFNRVGCTQAEFERVWRFKMNEWFNGWKETLHAKGLGFDFKPSRNKKDKPRSVRSDAGAK